jgi:hypothetical protein
VGGGGGSPGSYGSGGGTSYVESTLASVYNYSGGASGGDGSITIQRDGVTVLTIPANTTGSYTIA